jgi:hypothetical protein
MSDSNVPFEIEREFGLSHSDFHRIFPRIEPTVERISALRFDIARNDGRKLEIELSVEKIRKLGMLKIPYMAITFRFFGWNDLQRAEFFKSFERSFQKGGG